MTYRKGDRVLYERRVYYVISEPVYGTMGVLYTISEVPPPIEGVSGYELEPA